MLLSNAYYPDLRVERAARALIQAGYKVDLYCWDRKGELKLEELDSGFQIHRLKDTGSTYGAGWRQIFAIPRFWFRLITKIIDQTKKTNQFPDVIHCHDLDTLPAGLLLKGRFKCQVIFDAHENYPLNMTHYLPHWLTRGLMILEKLLLRWVDHIITASSVLADDYRIKSHKPVTVIGNVPNLADYQLAKEQEITVSRSSLGLKPGIQAVFYIGGFTRNRVLLPLIRAMDGLDNWQLHIWGDGHQRQDVEQAVARYNNVHYHGWAASSDLPRLFQTADVIYYCLRGDHPASIYNAPNTLTNAMASGRPLIANDLGDLGRIITESQCGILLQEVTSSSIRVALHQLSDPAFRQELGENGRQAALTRYNWENMAEELIRIYRELVK